MIITCPNVPLAVLPIIAQELRKYGPVVEFDDATNSSGYIECVAGRLEFIHVEDDNNTLLCHLVINNSHFPARMIIGGVKQFVEEACELAGVIKTKITL